MADQRSARAAAHGREIKKQDMFSLVSTEMDARVGMTCGMFIKRFCTVAWVLTGLCAVAIYVDQRGSADFDVDHVYGLMARDLLPDILPGLVGIFIASMLAAVMSSCDAFMVACSALFTENVYRKLIVTDADDRHYMWVGRLVSLLVVVCAIGYAFTLQDVMEGLKVFWKISAMMGLAFWIGLFWRRATPAGAWAGTLVSFALLLLTSRLGPAEHALWDFNASCAHHLPGYMLHQGQLYLPWQMLFYLVPGLVVIALSRHTPSPRPLSQRERRAKKTQNRPRIRDHPSKRSTRPAGNLYLQQCVSAYVFKGDRPVPLFTKKKDLGVQSFILKVVNNNCSELGAMAEGPRLEGRVNLVLPVLIIPVEGRRTLLTGEAFNAVTKEFSTSGIAIVLDWPKGLDEVIVGFRWEGDMTFVRAVAKHLSPMGGGFHQLGLQMTEIVHAGDYPGLASMTI